MKTYEVKIGGRKVGAVRAADLRRACAYGQRKLAEEDDRVPLDGDQRWRTRDGREVMVGEMGNQHVRNTLRFLIRQTAKLQIKLAVERDANMRTREKLASFAALLQETNGDVVRARARAFTNWSELHGTRE